MEILDLKTLITVRNIVAINEARQEITIEASLKLFWKDKRINIRDDVSEYDGKDEHGKFIVMDSRFADYIWIPDIFIDQASPADMYAVAKLNAEDIETKVLDTLGVADLSTRRA